MSEEESFVILGTSPMSSLEYDVIAMKERSMSTPTQYGSDDCVSKSLLENTEKNCADAIQTKDSIKAEMQVASLDIEDKKKPIDAPDVVSHVESGNLTKDKSTETTATTVLQSGIVLKSLLDWSLGALENNETSKKNNSGESITVSQTGTPSAVCNEITDDIYKSGTTSTQLSGLEMKRNNLSTEQILELKQELANSKLWSKPQQPQEHDKKDMMHVCSENYASSPVKEKQDGKQKEVIDRKEIISSVSKLVDAPTQTISSNSQQSPQLTTIKKSTPPTSYQSHLAASFIMGEISSNDLKTSIYSQFPSLSIKATAEEVEKLQNLITEHYELKSTLKSVNNGLKLFINNYSPNSVNAREKEAENENQKEIAMLQKQNQELKSQVEASEIARRMDHEATIQEISLKNSIIENMREQICGLEEKLMSFKNGKRNGKTNERFDMFYMKREEHELQMKDMRRQLSEIAASNLQFLDKEKLYIDELDCLKVNLTAAEELIMENKRKIKNLEATIQLLQKEKDDQNECINLLKHQNKVHCNDFEIERQNLERVLKEKRSVLEDLRKMQKRNQDLIEERQKLLAQYENSSRVIPATEAYPSVSSSPHPETYTNRPIRKLPSESAAKHFCPMCNKAFTSLYLLQGHVNDCIDNN